MSEILLLYLWTRLDAIGALAVTSAGMLAFGWVIMAWLVICEDDQDLMPKFRVCSWVLSLAVLVAVLVPSKTDLAIIVGGKIAIDAARSPEAAEIGSAVRDLVLRELREGAKK